MKIFRFLRKRRGREIEVDEILLDASNLPAFDRERLEGRMELPIGRGSIIAVGVIFTLIAVVFLGQLFRLQIVEGESYALRSENNRLDTFLIFSERGVIYDRNGERLAWNGQSDGMDEFAERLYSDRRGMGQLLGYVNYPRKDSSGFYFRTEYIGRGGVEETYDDELRGENGQRLVEVDAVGNRISEGVIDQPNPGESVTLSIDAELSEALYDHIEASAEEFGFRSGAAAIMDVRTGEIVALTSYPSFDPEVLMDGSDEALIEAYNTDDRLPFLNKIIAGIYTPGSIVKPFMALAALAEGIIDPHKIIVSRGSISVPNPYDPDNPSIFTDWRAHGPVDMRSAIAVSSNIYFYYVGGGFEDQVGLGIRKIHEYMQRFGFGQTTGIQLSGELAGVVPNPEWKEEIFDDAWRLGDTYLTSIGQYGFQVTPLQMLRAYAAIANGGTLLTPTIIKSEHPNEEVGGIDLHLDPDDLTVVREGMRKSAIEGTARALNRSDVHFAGKTGTAELGSTKTYVHSWVVGYFPYEEPRYSFIMLMERGPRANLFGAAPVMSKVVSWMVEHKPEYFFTDQTTE